MRPIVCTMMLLCVGASAKSQDTTDCVSTLPSSMRDGCTACHGCDMRSTATPPVYDMYTTLVVRGIPTRSTTIDMPIAPQPTPASLVCLSCHDGMSRPGGGPSTESSGLTIGTDLSREHPISIEYLPHLDGRFRAVDGDAGGAPTVDGLPIPDGRVECVSCHEHHSMSPGAVRRPRSGRELCLGCHDL